MSQPALTGGSAFPVALVLDLDLGLAAVSVAD